MVMAVIRIVKILIVALIPVIVIVGGVDIRKILINIIETRVRDICQAVLSI